MFCDINTEENIDTSDNKRTLEECYTYIQVTELLLSADSRKYKHWKCRTIGILRSVNGHFYLNDINEESNLQIPKLLVSMLYQDNIPNSVLPMTVQLFGTLQWVEKPVLLVEIMHVINPKLAVNLCNSLSTIINFQTNNKPFFNR